LSQLTHPNLDLDHFTNHATTDGIIVSTKLKASYPATQVKSLVGELSDILFLGNRTNGLGIGSRRFLGYHV
jgi:hypothetical protein